MANFQDNIRESYDASHKALKVNVVAGNLEAGDLEIGAVEIKNSTDDTRAVVGSSGLEVDVKRLAGNVTINSGNITLKGTVTLSVDGYAIGSSGLNADDTSPGTAMNVGGFGYVYDGSTWDRTRGDSTNGLLVNLGSNNDVSFLGNVTLDYGSKTQLANASGVVAVVSSSQPAGTENGLYVRIAGFYSGANLGVTAAIAPYSYYNQSSLVSGYVFHGLTPSGTNPTVSGFRIQRETLDTGEVLFADGATTFLSAWSSASLASIDYI